MLESRGYCAEITSWPSAWNAGITLLKHEPSARIPWQNTRLGLVPEDIVRLLLVWTRGYRPPNTTIVRGRITQRYRHGNCTSVRTWTAVNGTAAEPPGGGRS